MTNPEYELKFTRKYNKEHGWQRNPLDFIRIVTNTLIMGKEKWIPEAAGSRKPGRTKLVYDKAQQAIVTESNVNCLPEITKQITDTESFLLRLINKDSTVEQELARDQALESLETLKMDIKQLQRSFE